jgi:hypothetical protein
MKMKMMKIRRLGEKRIKGTLPNLLVIFLLAGCGSGFTSATQTPRPDFIPPTADPAVIQGSGAAFTPLPTRQLDCENQLEFIDDLTIPDGTEVGPGESISKRWLVKNTGSCSWDKSYSLQLISGLALGADKLQDLHPARSSAEAILEIVFTAPDNPGRYNSWWQASDPDGDRFGDPIYLEISVISD